MNADKSRNKDKEKDASLSSQQSSTHKVGRNVMDTADVARASIAKGLRAPEDVFAADIRRSTGIRFRL
jgi:cysteine sulfinate desulfinase/cysteine desulfurase-like protein